jgi:lipopolysaccharide biosynthesis glycosyltransferase
MFFLLLESIYAFGKLSHHTEILVYTCTEFQQRIEKSPLYSTWIRFEINDNYHSIDKACKARLDFFDLVSSSRYEKVLYLDTDIIVKKEIEILFHSVVQQDILYVMEEFTIDDDRDYWGKSLCSQEELLAWKGRSAFSTCVLLFKNCPIIKNLMNMIQQDMISRKHFFVDQGYIVYNAFKLNLFDNQIMKNFVYNVDPHSKIPVSNSLIIYHFPFRPGSDCTFKFHLMNNFLQVYKSFWIEIITVTDSFDWEENRCLPAIENKTYSWAHAGFIMFQEDLKIHNIGSYACVNDHIIHAYFGGEKHTLHFNKNYSEFYSIRKRDLEIVIGNLQTNATVP